MDETPQPPIEPLDSEPRWTHEIREQVVARIGPFFTTAREYVFHPSRFGVRWASGEHFAMNPLWFAAGAIAAMTTLETAFEDLIGQPERRTVLQNALRTISPYVYYVSIGVGAHALLHLTGSRRRLSSSVAMSLYAGGTMATLGQLMVIGTCGIYTLAYGKGWSTGPMPESLQATLTILLTMAFTAFYTVFGWAMGGLHKTSVLRVFLANTAGMAVGAVVSGFIPPPTMHVALSIWRGGHWAMPQISATAGF